MRIVSCKVENYKSFFSSDEVHLTSGFNVIVGQNNAGKTAFVEALSMQFSHKPHRSLETVPYLGTNVIDSASSAKIAFELSMDELVQILKDSIKKFYLPQTPSMSAQSQEIDFLRSLSEQNVIECHYQPDNFISANFQAYNVPHHGTAILFQIERSDETPKLVAEGQNCNDKGYLAYVLAGILKSRIYFFNAERLNIAQSQIGPDLTLNSRASNLPQVLHFLQSYNVSRFERFNQFVSEIFPEIKQVTIPPISNNLAQILVWSIDPKTERADLAIPLSESGTGIGQVLAILYVVLTSDFPRTIIIDEPQSFLHPGAVRKLFDILKQHPQHQYVITTHSPTAVTAADPETIFLIRKEEAKSKIETIEVAETMKLRLFLHEVGARLSDVFGADNIFWVEGRTEELCFPMILKRVAEKSLMGIVILGVRNTGDFEGRHSRTIFEIYSRLSEGKGLLPAAIGFVFDKEGKSEKTQEDIKRQGKGKVEFLPRRMYENYLLNPGGIAAVLSRRDSFTGKGVTVDEVEKWMKRNRWNKKYFKAEQFESDQSEKTWLEKANGAKLLDDIFKECSENRVCYDKIEDGVELTKWIIENNRDDLLEISALLNKVLAGPKGL